MKKDKSKVSEEKDLDDIDCPYKDICVSFPNKCSTCIHNMHRKKDYYEPDYSKIHIPLIYNPYVLGPSESVIYWGSIE